MPDGLSLVNELDFLSPDQARFLGQVQGRTYANMFGLVERFIGAKMIEVGRDHCARRPDRARGARPLHRRGAEAPGAVPARRAARRRRHAARLPLRRPANDVASFVLGKSTWAVLALTCHIELFSQAHYRASIAAATGLSPLFKDIFLFHWKEESQHAVIDELEWIREDAKLASSEARDAAVDDLIALVGGVDGILQGAGGRRRRLLPAPSRHGCGRRSARVQVAATVLKAYRWQYIVSGAIHPHFQKVLGGLVSPAQMARIQAALAPLTYAMPAQAEAAAAMTH